jgi:hypothetical protein
MKLDLKETLLDARGSGQGKMAGCCEHGNEPSGSINGGYNL